MLPLNKLVCQRQAEDPGRFCIGLDPEQDKTPDCIKGPSEGIRAAIHMMAIVDATHNSVAAYKPQRAHWEALQDGVAGLRMVVAYIHTSYPGIPVILDCKRGDIDRTQKKYGYAHLVLDGVDGMNFNPYMGADCLEPLVAADVAGLAEFITLGRTSNSKAWQIQDATLMNGQRVWEYTLACAVEWAKRLGVLHRFGVVMGVAHDAAQLRQYDDTICEHDEHELSDNPIYNMHLVIARRIAGDQALFLHPGLGKQKGHTEATILASWRGPGTMLLSSSSGITQASMGEDFADAAGRIADDQCTLNRRVIAAM